VLKLKEGAGSLTANDVEELNLLFTQLGDSQVSEKITEPLAAVQ
jgi:hypothetical protein